MRRTLLLYGEGKVGERVFLKHLRSLCSECFRLMDRNGLTITVDSDHGNSPDHVINEAGKLLMEREYDRCIILLDLDLAWPSNLLSRMAGTDIIYAGCDPCLEGTMLRVQSHASPPTSTACKNLFYGVNKPKRKRAANKILNGITWPMIRSACKYDPVLRMVLDHFTPDGFNSHPPGSVYFSK